MNKELKEILSSISETKDQIYTEELEIKMKKFYINTNEYNKTYDKLINKVDKISSKTFDGELYDFIYNSFNDSKYKSNFIEDLKNKYPLKNFHIFSNIYNLFWKGEINLGTHILHDPTTKIKERILSIAKKENTRIEINEESNFWIETIVEARDYQAACEIGKIKNDEFLDALSFILYSPNKLFSKFLITIGYEISHSNFQNFFATEGEISTLTDYLLENTISKELASPEILKKLLTLNEQSFLERKIKSSLHWFREALQEKNEVTSFLKMMISLESLLSFQEENFMTPSISHGIGENVALILEKNVEERVNLYNIIKTLYGYRSAIVHSGKSTRITYNTKITLANIVVKLIFELVTNEKYKIIIDQKSYIEYFRKIKFS